MSTLYVAMINKRHEREGIRSGNLSAWRSASPAPISKTVVSCAPSTGACSTNGSAVSFVRPSDVERLHSRRTTMSGER